MNSELNRLDVSKEIELSYLASKHGNFDDFKKDALSKGWSNADCEKLTHTFASPPLPTSETSAPKGTTASMSKPSNETGFFAQYLSHLRGQKWQERTVVNVADTVEETYLRLGTKHARIRKEKRPGYGLVVGRIQSGKTAHMLGLAFRALDDSLVHHNEHYDTVIILSGLLEDLRQQTYNRAVATGIVGIRFLPETSDFSTSNNDAKNEIKDVMEQDEPVILIIKKNHTVIEALNDYLLDDWIKMCIEGKRRILIIDDECDHASIDSTHAEVQSDQENATITATNRAVRRLIKFASIGQAVTWYVGYTATPYSNLLMDPDPEHIALDEYGLSLFPRDMIHSLPKPEQHYDNAHFFKKNSPNIQRFESPEPDSSSEKAHIRMLILLHVLTKLIREQRKKASNEEGEGGKKIKKHSTMIHTEIEKEQHLRTANLVSKLLDELCNKPEQDLTKMLNKVCKTYYPDEEKEISTLLSEYEASPILSVKIYFSEITVVKLNSEKTEREDEYRYPNELAYNDGTPFSHIVVGGLKLSRGITIEDLVIVWFDRYSETPNYDTLLQMARWCGYRHSFIDLIRIFMCDDTICHFSLIADVERRLRTDLEKFTKDTDPMKQYQWIREYKGMRISPRASPNASENSNPSSDTYLEPEYHLEDVHERLVNGDLAGIQFQIFDKFRQIVEWHQPKTVLSEMDKQFKIFPASWKEFVRDFLDYYNQSYEQTVPSKRFLQRLMKESEDNEVISSDWNIAIFVGNTDIVYEGFTLSSLGKRLSSSPRSVHIPQPMNSHKADFYHGQIERDSPLLVVFIENSSKTDVGGVPVYHDNEIPTLMLSIYLPEKGLSPTFVEYARPGIKLDGTIKKEEEE